MAKHPKPARPHARNGYWYLIRRVPKEVAHLDGRGQVQITTGIRVEDDPKGVAASDAIRKLDTALMEYWRDLAAGGDPDALGRYERAAETARSLGFAYLTARELSANSAIEDLVRRVETAVARERLGKPDDDIAVLGAAERPQIRISELAGEYETIISATFVRKSENQKKRWRVQRKSAAQVFIDVLEVDKTIDTITREDVLALRDHFKQRVINGEIEIGTGNKMLGRVASMFNAVNEEKRLNIAPLFSKATIPGETKEQRVPYAIDFVQKHFLADGMFDDLNEQARGIVFVVAELGVRPSEACSLSGPNIRLTSNVPHLRVRDDGRETKTKSSWREIPLVGVALIVMRKFPNGFPRYHDRNDALSALINKALTFRKLRPEPGQSFYSLRHTFKDRLIAVETPENIIDDLMGHASKKPKYGSGIPLDQKLKWLELIAFTPPASI